MLISIMGIRESWILGFAFWNSLHTFGVKWSENQNKNPSFQLSLIPIIDIDKIDYRC